MVLFSCYTIHVLIVILYYCITVLRYYRITVTVTVTVTVTDATAATGTAAAAATVTVSVTILYYTVLYYTIPYHTIVKYYDVLPHEHLKPKPTTPTSHFAPT